MGIKKCIGCGVVLQSDNENELGYIPEHKYQESSYCQRCFRLIHYDKKIVSKSLVDDEKILEVVNKSDSYAIFLIDFLNVNNETISMFKRININKTLVISKSDLIFDSISKDKMKERLKNIYDLNDDIIFLSSKNKLNINFVFKKLEELKLRECYILGFTNAGKSTLINTIRESDDVVVSNMPNTTLDFLKFKIKNYTIIDTPGFSYQNKFYEDEDFDLIKRVNPKYFVRPVTYQVKENQIFKLENNIYIKDFGYNSVTFYMSNLIKIKKIYKDENIEYKEFNVDNDSDIVIPSFGFIFVKKACIIKIDNNIANFIEIRKSIIK